METVQETHVSRSPDRSRTPRFSLCPGQSSGEAWTRDMLVRLGFTRTDESITCRSNDAATNQKGSTYVPVA